MQSSNICFFCVKQFICNVEQLLWLCTLKKILITNVIVQLFIEHSTYQDSVAKFPTGVAAEINDDIT